MMPLLQNEHVIYILFNFHVSIFRQCAYDTSTVWCDVMLQASKKKCTADPVLQAGDAWAATVPVPTNALGSLTLSIWARNSAVLALILGLPLLVDSPPRSAVLSRERRRDLPLGSLAPDWLAPLEPPFAVGINWGAGLPFGALQERARENVARKPWRNGSSCHSLQHILLKEACTASYYDTTLTCNARTVMRCWRPSLCAFVELLRYHHCIFFFALYVAVLSPLRPPL